MSLTESGSEIKSRLRVKLTEQYALRPPGGAHVCISELWSDPNDLELMATPRDWLL